MTIDFHTHPIPEAFRQALQDMNIDPIEDDGFPLPEWTADAHLDFMAQAGIDYSVLSLPSPHFNIEDNLKNLYYDIAGDPEPIQLNMLLMITDVSHLMFGTDYPHSPAPVILKKKMHLEENDNYKTLLPAIYDKNGRRLLEMGIKQG